MRKDFYIFRHGETDLNRQKRWQGSGADYDLNAAGVAQAQQAVEKLRGKNIEIIFSSPLVRARHTAQIAAEALEVPVVVKDDLRECFYGEAEGRLIADLQKEWPQVLDNWYNPQCWNIRFPGGESKFAVLQRVLAQLQELVDEPYQSVGVAIHGGTMGALLNHFEVPFAKIPNCAAFHLIYENGVWRVEGSLF